jgi:hypothetical protein
MVTKSQSKARVLAALEVWAREHPHRQSPVLLMLGRSFKPDDIVDEVRSETRLGRDLVTYLEDLARRNDEPIERSIEMAIRINAKSA